MTDDEIGQQLEAALWDSISKTSGDAEPCGFVTVFTPWVLTVPDGELPTVTVAAAVFAFRMIRASLMLSQNQILDPIDSGGVMVPITVADDESTHMLCDYIQGGINLEHDQLVDWILDHEPRLAVDLLHQAMHLAADATEQNSV